MEVAECHESNHKADGCKDHKIVKRLKDCPFIASDDNEDINEER